MTLNQFYVIGIGVLYVGAIALIIYLLIKGRSSVNKIDAPGPSLDPPNIGRFTKENSDRLPTHLDRSLINYYSPTYNQYVLNHCVDGVLEHQISFPNLFDHTPLESLNAWMKRTDVEVLPEDRRRLFQDICVKQMKEGFWIESESYPIGIVYEAGEIDPAAAEKVREHMKNLKDGSPMFINTQTGEIDTKAMGDINETDSKQEQDKENLYDMESDLEVFTSNCCKVPTKKPKMGAAKCPKCNKFTKLI
jgi:hypothetical protein